MAAHGRQSLNWHRKAWFTVAATFDRTHPGGSILEMPRGPHAWGARYQVQQAVREGLASRFEGRPDVHYANDGHFVDAHRQTSISKWLLTGTTREGRQVEVRGCDFCTFRDDQVIRKDSYWKVVEA